MRYAVGIFGILGALCLIGFVAQAAFMTSDTFLVGVSSGIFFGMIATAGLCGPAVAKNLWTNHSRIGGVVVGLIAVAALVSNVMVSLGGIAGRGDLQSAETRKQALNEKDTRADLERLLRERDGMSFKVTTTDVVQGARDAVLAAERTRKAECDKANNVMRCRERESDEKARRTELQSAALDHAQTLRAEKIDGEIGRLREQLKTANPTRRDNPQAVAMAGLLGLAETEIARVGFWQNFAIAVLLELVVAGSLFVAEVMRGPVVSDAKVRASGATENDTPAVAPPAAIAAPMLIEERADLVAVSPALPAVVDATPAPVVVREEPATIVQPNDAPDAAPAPRVEGDIAAFFVAHVHPSPARDVLLGQVYAQYCAWCVANGTQAKRRSAFDRWVAHEGAEVGLRVEQRGKKPVLRNVELAA